MANNTMRLSFKNVHLTKCNFQGRLTEYNTSGKRECLIVLTIDHAHDLGFNTIAEMVEELQKDDWAIKQYKPSERNEEEGTEPNAYMNVRAIFYEKRRSNIYLVNEAGKSVELDEDSVGDIDRNDIRYADIVINKHFYDFHGKQGYNNEIKSMAVYIEEDEIQSRFGNNGSSYSDDMEDDM